MPTTPTVREKGFLGPIHMQTTAQRSCQESDRWHSPATGRYPVISCVSLGGSHYFQLNLSRENFTEVLPTSKSV